MSHSLFADLPVVRQSDTIAPAAPIVCVICGSPKWTRCKPGTAPTSEIYRSSNIVALRDDDGEPMEAWCTACDPLMVRS